MEAGSSARHVDEITTQVAIGLGAERVGLRVDYASLAITISAGSDAVSRMRRVGPVSANESLHQVLNAVLARIAQGGSVEEARTELMMSLLLGGHCSGRRGMRRLRAVTGS
jgi:hypothetical protein